MNGCNCEEHNHRLVSLIVSICTNCGSKYVNNIDGYLTITEKQFDEAWEKIFETEDKIPNFYIDKLKKELGFKVKE